MSSSGTHTKGLRKFLDDSGVLVNGSEEEIKAARRQYRKQYLRNYKKSQREENSEFSVLISKQNREQEIITVARRHKMSVTTFLKMATLAYVNKTFLVPDRELVSKLAQLLTDCLNEVQQIAHTKANYSWQLEQQYESIEKRIENLEEKIVSIFSEPLSIEDAVFSAINKDSDLRVRLLMLLTSSNARRT